MMLGGCWNSVLVVAPVIAGGYRTSFSNSSSAKPALEATSSPERRAYYEGPHQEYRNVSEHRPAPRL